ncbi:MarR family winged helix-turn-helix transcriptional regulator [Aeromicrobium stalagmiti]|uniref:MarR family winged helix-turn-helix transcriptional regulator n=1 Tax=Aeromicrobium stalagmiti TaxID=2738988 RepID=UPI00156A663F|nr:MarR family winged helix-turn-helix transcriptional regulator [Aeromicrobium stalagmiti]NRQ50774.1 winged helix-turn-helix transcriptional regulator [Aeromicrobium stalagmiti]
MTSELPAGLDVDFELTRFIRRVRARSLRTLGEIHPKLDYGMFTFLLSICDSPEGIRGSELAEELGVHKSTASRAIASMERIGLITRVPDPDDGRAQLLLALPETQAKVAEYRRKSHERLVTLIDDWTPEEVEVFARSLTRLNDRAERDF